MQRSARFARRLPTASERPTSVGEERWLSNHHKMLPDRDYTYEGCTGGKTGFTQAALNTLVTYAEWNGRRLVCVSSERMDDRSIQIRLRC